MNSAIVGAGTKYLAISLSGASNPLAGKTILRLTIPSKHFRSASNTPEPEFPVVATSLIFVEYFVRRLAGRCAGGVTLERAALRGVATTTAAPGSSGL